MAKKQRPSGKPAQSASPGAGSDADRILSEIADLDLFLAADLRRMLAGMPSFPPAPIVGTYYQPTITSTTC